MAALLVAGIVGLFSETAIKIDFTEISHIFIVIQWLVRILRQLVNLSYLLLKYF